MNSAFIIFPNQLFEDLSPLNGAAKVFLVEDDLYFKQYAFHQQKLVFHRASMQSYQVYLEKHGIRAKYQRSTDESSMHKLFRELSSNKIISLKSYEPHDFYLKKRIVDLSTRYGIEYSFIKHPSFFLDAQDAREHLGTRGSYLMGRFYTNQRQSFNLLMDASGKPTGGKWSYDDENRKKLPKTITPPLVAQFDSSSACLKEAKAYVMNSFQTAKADSEHFNYAFDFESAKMALTNFLEERFSNYGTYQDAITERSDFVFHSVISPYLNSGLLSPHYVIERTLSFGKENQVPLNSIEGFIRQILGWREYVMLLYEQEGVFMRTRNYFDFQRPMPKAFYMAETGIPPVDNAIKKSLKYAYCHHIERLMILGNFMLLCEIKPNAIYQWFMEMFIDAYDWVMVANVYGMSQYADGGLICTKPYISGSNYILKMSDYKKGPWTEIWDGLYWRFLHVHRAKFESNFRMSMMLRLLDKMDSAKLQKHLDTANNYIENLK